VVFPLFRELWGKLSSKRKKQLSALLLLMIIVSFAEIINIAAVIPFIGVILSPDKVLQNKIITTHLESIPFLRDNIVGFVTFIFVILVLVAGILRISMLWSINKLSFAIGSELGLEIFRKALYQSFQAHLDVNSSEVIDAVYSKINGVINIIIMAMNLIGSIVVATFIILTMLLINPHVAILIFGGLGSFYYLVLRATKKRLHENSEDISKKSVQVIKILQESLGGIRDIILDGTQEVYCTEYRNADKSVRDSQVSNNFINQCPRFMVEVIGIAVIAFCTFWLSKSEEVSLLTIPIIGAIAIGLQKLLPTMQLSYSSWAAIKGNQAVLKEVLFFSRRDDVLALRDAQQVNDEKLNFQKNIAIENLSFRYKKNSSLVLRGISIVIEKGEKIGIIGATGSGKSTLLDLLMGLLAPTAGGFRIDTVPVNLTNNKSWYRMIAHVPQNVFLSDSTIYDNIAFGVDHEQANLEKIQLAAKKACLSEWIESLPDQYNTRIGERGIQLSGGQRQRIGIARALFRDASIIILDEATSSLDSGTELSISEAITDLGDEKTIVVVAHRISTLKDCSKIIEIENGSIKRICKYSDIHKIF
jgi:ATP-binding cassette, subfamily B, bacterial PglK